MRLLAEEFGYWQLREIRRFDNDWEGVASLRLRARDPEAFTAYDQRGQVRDGNAEEVTNRAVRSWLSDFLAGKDTLLLASTNEEAAELSRRARSWLISLGRVDEHGGSAELSDGNQASTGDLIRARENNKKIDADGRTLANRDVLKVTGWTGAGKDRHAVAMRRLDCGGWSAPFAVPASYLAEHATLAYAGNTAVAQGQTVDTAHFLVGLATGRRSLYVGMTRGRERNTAHVATSWPLAPNVGGNRAAPDLGEAMSEPVPAQAVWAACLEHDDDTEHLTATEVMRQAQDETAAMPRLHSLWKEATRGRSFAAYDNEVRRRLPAAEFDRYMNDPQRPVLHRQLRAVELAGHSVPVTLEAVCGGDMTGARSVAAVLHGRIGKLNTHRGEGHTRNYTERTPHIDDPGLAKLADDSAAAMDQRAHELGRQAADQPPQWAVRYLGVPPAKDGRLRQDWIERAGQVASYRELTGHADPIEAIGPLPATGAPEQREAWAACARALEMRGEETGIRGATRGELEAQVKAYERTAAWADHKAGKQETTTKQRQGLDPGLFRREADTGQATRPEHPGGREAAADDRDRAELATAELARRGHPQPPTGTGPNRLPEHDPDAERTAITRDVAETIERERQYREQIEHATKQHRGLDPDLFRPGRWHQMTQAQDEATPQPDRLFQPDPWPAPQTAADPSQQARADASAEAETTTSANIEAER